MKLHHIHLPNLSPYPLATTLQTNLTRLHHHTPLPPFPSPPPPRPIIPPYILTFTPPPTYTTGRRDLSRLKAPQISHLRAGGTAEFYETLRGGQTTFHGPGQVVAYVVLNLKTHGLGVRSYIEMLEAGVIGTVERWGTEGGRVEGWPGVWVGGSEGRKIASVGVRLRRGVASYGVGINVDTDLGWFERIEACGLPGSRVTSMVKEMGLREDGLRRQGDTGKAGVKVGVKEVADAFAEEIAGRLGGVEGVVDLSVEEIGIEALGMDRESEVGEVR